MRQGKGWNEEEQLTKKVSRADVVIFPRDSCLDLSERRSHVRKLQPATTVTEEWFVGCILVNETLLFDEFKWGHSQQDHGFFISLPSQITSARDCRTDCERTKLTNE
uniref:BRCT domain-containing protein n=1 Tax=Ascaris lumbricoides TaxID=6252 RepID=A0A0M3HXY0_ASCLU